MSPPTMRRNRTVTTPTTRPTTITTSASPRRRPSSLARGDATYVRPRHEHDQSALDHDEHHARDRDTGVVEREAEHREHEERDDGRPCGGDRTGNGTERAGRNEPEVHH